MYCIFQIISKKTRLALFAEFGKRGWRQEEPGEQIPPELPRRFERLVYRALSEDYISRSRAEELLGLPVGGVSPEAFNVYARSAIHSGN